MPPVLNARLVERVLRTPVVESFRFEPAAPVDFVPGQFVRLIFDCENTAGKDLNKYLSLSCAPGKGYLEVTKKLSDSQFSQRLKDLRPGDELLFQGHMGGCVLQEGCARIGFLTGGIGITPVISMIEHIVKRKLPTDVVLLYSNRRDDDIAFLKELDGWQAAHKSIKVVHTVADYRPADPRFRYGMITGAGELLAAEMPDRRDRTIYIFGPPAMVDAMKKICVEAACEMGKLRTESFLGY